MAISFTRAIQNFAVKIRQPQGIDTTKPYELKKIYESVAVAY